MIWRQEGDMHQERKRRDLKRAAVRLSARVKVSCPHCGSEFNHTHDNVCMSYYTRTCGGCFNQYQYKVQPYKCKTVNV